MRKFILMIGVAFLTACSSGGDGSIGGTPQIDSCSNDGQKQFVLDALESCGWRIQGPEGAAARLELSPSTLRSRMRRLGIKRS